MDGKDQETWRDGPEVTRSSSLESHFNSAFMCKCDDQYYVSVWLDYSDQLFGQTLDVSEKYFLDVINI